jgi:hypothetical protein
MSYEYSFLIHQDVGDKWRYWLFPDFRPPNPKIIGAFQLQSNLLLGTTWKNLLANSVMAVWGTLQYAALLFHLDLLFPVSLFARTTLVCPEMK